MNNKILDSTENILSIISINNDNIIKQTDRLKIILLNLKIEDARIKENTGIVPITNELEKIINELHNKTNKIIQEHRKILNDNFKTIENEFK